VFRNLRLKYINYNFPVVLYGRVTLSLTQREEHRLRVSEDRVLRVFGSKEKGMA
jgi:hypothetical protein